MEGKAPLVDSELQQLVDFAKDTDLQEIAIEKNGRSFQIRRSGVHPVKRSSLSAAPAPAVPEEAAKPAEPVYIRSTMVGTFFRADSPDRPPLVVEGTVVESGQPVGSVEAMKILKDVVAPMPCRIRRALVADNHAVEYGQPLFEVEPVEENV